MDITRRHSAHLLPNAERWEDHHRRCVSVFVQIVRCAGSLSQNTPRSLSLPLSLSPSAIDDALTDKLQYIDSFCFSTLGDGQPTVTGQVSVDGENNTASRHSTPDSVNRLSTTSAPTYSSSTSPRSKSSAGKMFLMVGDARYTKDWPLRRFPRLAGGESSTCAFGAKRERTRQYTCATATHCVAHRFPLVVPTHITWITAT